MDELERKQHWMQELKHAADGKDDMAYFAQSAIQCCNDNVPWAGIFNYGVMKLVEGRKLEQEACAREFLNLFFDVLFHPKEQKYKEEIRQYFARITDNESKASIDRFIGGLEVVGNALQAYEQMDKIKNSELQNVKQELAKRRKHKYRHGEVLQAYALFKNIRGRDTPSLRQFKNWLAGKNVPDGFPGIDNLTKFSEWCRKWDAPERRCAGRSIGGMSEEEIYKKRKK